MVLEWIKNWNVYVERTLSTASPVLPGALSFTSTQLLMRPGSCTRMINLVGKCTVETDSLQVHLLHKPCLFSLWLWVLGRALQRRQDGCDGAYMLLSPKFPDHPCPKFSTVSGVGTSKLQTMCIGHQLQPLWLVML